MAQVTSVLITLYSQGLWPVCCNFRPQPARVIKHGEISCKYGEMTLALSMVNTPKSELAIHM